MIGYGFAGTFRDNLVRPPKMCVLLGRMQECCH
jgi:hypothetical protein